MRTKRTDDVKSARSLRMPMNDIGIGGTFMHNGDVYGVVESVVDVPADACAGCAFSGRDDREGYQSCPNVRCSGFDRSDGKFVWFVRLSR